MAYPNVLMVDDATIFKALSQTAKNGALICMHAENGSVIDVIIARALAEGKTAPIYHALTRPPRAEAEAVHRAIAMAEIAGAPVYIVHLSSRGRAESGPRGARPRRAGLRRDLPAVPAALDRGTRAPEFRRRQVRLHAAAASQSSTCRSCGTASSTITCRWSPPTTARSASKTRKILGKDDFTKIPNGGPGIENRLQLIYHHGVNAGKLSLNRFVEITSTTPARIFGMYPKKGEIAAGQRRRHRHLGSRTRSTPSAPHTHHMRVDYSMFEGYQVTGNARTVLSRGEVIVDGGEFLGKAGRGNYLKRTARGGAWK